MAMTVSRLGQVNGSGGVTALFLQIFSGEVLTAFQKRTKLLPHAMVKSITEGKSASFPATGLASAEYHTPGADIAGAAINHNEVVISIDGKLISHAFIADIDEAMNHYDARSIYSSAMGSKLASLMDEHIIIEGLKGAAASATVTGLPGGSSVTDSNLGSATAATRAQAFIDAIYEAAEQLDENDAPEEGRFIVLRPEDYYILTKAVQSTGFSAIHADYNGAGSLADGTILRLGGIDIIKSNNTPFGSNRAASGVYASHSFDATNYVGLVGVKDAVGVVKLMDLSMESEYLIRNQGTLMVAGYAVGIGYLRPECLIALKTA